jgi:hypothetical protein
LSDLCKGLNLENEYVMDSFPVAVFDNIRISRSRLVKSEHLRGRAASKGRCFYGFQVQVIAT